MENGGAYTMPDGSSGRRLLPAASGSWNPPLPKPTSQSPSRTLAPRKSHATAACETCRRRKVKCNAARPACSFCVSAGVNCVYSTSQDETHSQALKRKLSELNEKETTFEQIFEHLRDRSEEEADEIVKRIRAGADPDSILRYINDGDLLLQLALVPEARYRYVFPIRREMPEFLIRPDNPYLDSKVYDWTASGVPKPKELRQSEESPYVKPYHVAKLIDPLLSTVKPSEWTTVSSDDVFLRELLALYFLHEYQWFPFFHKDYFLQDMVAGRQGCCSSLLVNVVLAAASRTSLAISHRYEYWNPKNLGYQFLAEAKRLWDIELLSGRARLTTIQAGMHLNLVHIMNAMDVAGFSYTQQALDMARRLGVLVPPSGPKQNSRRNRAKAFTAWALFNWQCIISYTLFEPPAIPTPPAIPLPDPVADPGWYGQIWLRYPMDPKLYTTFFPQQFKAQCEVRMVMNKAWLQQFGHKGPVDPATALKQANDFYAGLKAWYDNLPPPLKPARITYPSQLMLHIHYHNVVAKLYEPSAGNPPGPPPQGSVSPPAPTPNPSSSPKSSPPASTGNINPPEIRTNSAQHFETLLRLYYLRHGFAHSDTFLGKPLIQLGFMSLGKIQALSVAPHRNEELDKMIDQTRSTLLLAVSGLHEQGRNIYLAQVILGVLRGKMGEVEKELVSRFIGGEEKASVGGMGGGVNGGGGSTKSSSNSDDDVSGSDGEDGAAKQPQQAAGPAGEAKSRLLPSAANFSDNPEKHRLGNLVSGMKQMRVDDETRVGDIDEE